MESTYGHRHHDETAAREWFSQALERTLARGGTVVIPSFIEWLRPAPPPSTVYLVHGEPEGSEALRDRIDRELGWTAVVPRSGERVLIR
ncbi:MBL fold metallo-hydrolase RNA specificity domain-containing protein [Kitasatospora sp. NPDC059811]|uniref:MBL fold metallo-hydrolase RNA specificity domain-containing protein n=1 Tax=Streptomycetaceae TaxID=2062 RepID=UPI0007AF5AEB|nr:MBL fold metallo-hydrolase RNA specificity domain-containing protein [Streptomyces sp. MJM8645]